MSGVKHLHRKVDGSLNMGFHLPTFSFILIPSGGSKYYLGGASGAGGAGGTGAAAGCSSTCHPYPLLHRSVSSYIVLLALLLSLYDVIGRSSS